MTWKTDTSAVRMVMGIVQCDAMAIDERDMVVSKQDKGKRNEGTNVTYMYTHSITVCQLI